MGLRDFLKPRIQDWTMRFMNDMRPETVAVASGDVLEVGFGTGLNLDLYPPDVKSVTGVDPLVTEGLPAVESRIAAAPFPVERHPLAADGGLPFDAGRFDCVITTWTLCSIPDAPAALTEMRRVLKPGGRYVFIEHGTAENPSTARWQNRVNPLWKRMTDGCNINRPIDRIVEGSGFELSRLDRFRAKGPGILAQMYRGIATRS
ncbi:MAG: class I SAM-dependent methyltransferase [Myxococcota bacterium]